MLNDLVTAPDNPAPELAEVIWYTGPEGQKLRAMIAPAFSRFARPRGTVVICPGRTEFIEKYFETVRDMQMRGFVVVVFDWPGQGLSARGHRDRLAGYIEDFSEYVFALRAGLNAIGARAPEPHVILAHSMGGAIALEALRMQVVTAEAAAFSSPMWGIKLPPLAGMIANFFCGLGMGRKLIVGHARSEKFEGNIVTGDRRRWDRQQELIAAKPDLALGSVTWRWVKAAIAVTRGFRRMRALEHVDLPIMVASAEREALVDNRSHAYVASQLRNVRHITVEGARHEILMETDDKRQQFLDAFDRLLGRADI